MRLAFSMVSLLLAGAAHAAPLTVATDLPPVHSLVSMVMGDRGEAVLLMDQGADAHDFQLRPSQARNLANADTVIWMGPEMTVWLEQARQSMRPDGNDLALLGVTDTIHRPYAEHSEEEPEDEHGHDDHDHEEHGHEEHSEETHDEHGHGSDDPHAWLDPSNARIWVDAIEHHLAALDPEGAATYAANAKRASETLSSLSDQVVATLAPYHEQQIVVFHDAYGHFSARFDVRIAGTIALGDAAAPSAAHLSELRDEITAKGVTCIFAEPQHNPAMVQQIASDLGLRTGVLDPMGSTLELGQTMYPALISGMADSIATCQKG